MKKVIDRHWINKDFTLHHHSNNKVTTRDELFHMIDFWKVLLSEKYSIKPGQLVGVQFILTDAYYFSLLFAIVELGASLLVLDKPQNQHRLENVKTKMFAPIDLVMVDSSYNEPLVKAVVDSNARQIGFKEEFDTYTIQHPDQFDSISKTVLANTDTVLLTTTTSGTTDIPQIVKHTHEFYHDLCIRNSHLLGFEQSSIVLHTRNLHHGSTLDLFFLPSLRSAGTHYYDNSMNAQVLVNVIADKKINFVYIVFNAFAYAILHNLPPLGHNLTLLVLSYLNPEWVGIVKEKNIHRILSSFGSSETGGPIFIPEITSQTKNFNPLNYGKLLDDFFKVDIVDSTLRVTNKVYKDSVIMHDSFTLNDGQDYIYHGRSNLIRINDVEFAFNELDRFTHEFFKDDGMVIVDIPRQKNYLALFNDFDPVLIEEFCIEFANQYGPNTIDLCDTLTISDFIVGIKVDRELLREYFRKKSV